MAASPRKKVCVIGAGWFGLVTAKTYLEIDPTLDLSILDSSPSLGGTWSAQRIHPHLVAQQPYGMYAFADLEIDSSHVPNPDHTFIPSAEVHAYMQRYADTFHLTPRLQLNTLVTQLQRSSTGGWDVHISDEPTPRHYDQVVVATGLTSTPSLPDLDTSAFTPAVFHSRELGARYHTLAADPNIKNVCVYGGGKSAMDSVYACVKAGKHVDWVVRAPPDGNGFVGLFPGELYGRGGTEVFSSRLGAGFVPSLDRGKGSWVHRWLHAGGIGEWVVWRIWEYMGRKMDRFAEYDKNENVAKLKPSLETHAVFWGSTGAGIITHPELLDHIRADTQLQVHRASITHLTGTTLTLSTGAQLPSDTLILATGYSPAPTIIPPPLAASLGVPTPLSTYPSSLHQKWIDLDTLADAEVVQRFPRLAEPPMKDRHPPKFAPYRLYNSVVPPQMVAERDRSIVFVGAVTVLDTTLMAEVVALWAAAWLAGELEVELSLAEMEWDVAMRTAFARRRYPLGGVNPFVLYEYFPMIEMMMKQLGLTMRQKKGLVAEITEAYKSRDLKGMVQEWKTLRGL